MYRYLAFGSKQIHLNRNDLYINETELRVHGEMEILLDHPIEESSSNVADAFKLCLVPNKSSNNVESNEKLDSLDYSENGNGNNGNGLDHSHILQKDDLINTNRKAKIESNIVESSYALVYKSPDLIPWRAIKKLQSLDIAGYINFISLNITKIKGVERIVLVIPQSINTDTGSSIKNFAFEDLLDIIKTMIQIHKLVVSHGDINHTTIVRDKDKYLIRNSLNDCWGVNQMLIYQHPSITCIHPYAKQDIYYPADYYALGVFLLHLYATGIGFKIDYESLSRISPQDMAIQKLDEGSFTYICRMFGITEEVISNHNIQGQGGAKNWVLTVAKMLLNHDETQVINTVHNIAENGVNYLLSIQDSTLLIKQPILHGQFHNKKYYCLNSLVLAILYEKILDAHHSKSKISYLISGMEKNQVSSKIIRTLTLISVSLHTIINVLKVSNKKTNETKELNHFYNSSIAFLLSSSPTLLLPASKQLVDVRNLDRLIAYAKLVTDISLMEQISVIMQGRLLNFLFELRNDTKNLQQKMEIFNTLYALVNTRDFIIKSSIPHLINNIDYTSWYYVFMVAFRDIHWYSSSIIGSKICFNLIELLTASNEAALNEIFSLEDGSQNINIYLFIMKDLKLKNWPTVSINPKVAKALGVRRVILLKLLSLAQSKQSVGKFPKIALTHLCEAIVKELFVVVCTIIMGYNNRSRISRIWNKAISNGSLSKIILALKHQVFDYDKEQYFHVLENIKIMKNKIMVYRNNLNFKDSFLNKSRNVATHLYFFVFLFYIIVLYFGTMIS